MIIGEIPEGAEKRTAAGLTGRYLLTVNRHAHHHVSSKLAAIGIPADRPISRAAGAARPLAARRHLMLGQLGVAVVDISPAQQAPLKDLASDDSVIAVEPERIVRALGSSASDIATWGLIATKVLDSRYSGANVKLAVLDTGLDLGHPDFAGREIVTANFVGDDSAFHDGVGHGTHCMGVAAGPLLPAAGPRYGIAYEALPYSARVLDDMARGGDFNVLQGIDWAIAQGCSVISLSFGTPWMPGRPPFSQAYEAAAQRALASGCLIVTAAGNEAAIPGYVGAVGYPGSCPSVLTVAAVDRSSATAVFSDRQSLQAPGVKGPDLAAPGVGIYSSWAVDSGSYRVLSGTSVASPYVAGIAALLAGSDATLRGQALKDKVLEVCLPLGPGATRQGEIGRGLVQAP